MAGEFLKHLIEWLSDVGVIQDGAFPWLAGAAGCQWGTRRDVRKVSL